jgi:hypothetical protein
VVPNGQATTRGKSSDLCSGDAELTETLWGDEELSGLGEALGNLCLRLAIDSVRVAPHGVEVRIGEPGVDDSSESEERKITWVGFLGGASGELSISIISWPSSPMYQPLFFPVCTFVAEHSPSDFARMTKIPCFRSMASEISPDAVRGLLPFGGLLADDSSLGGRSPGVPGPDAMAVSEED